MIALVPARGGSKRIPGKNFKELGGKPLLLWTIEAACEVGFDRVYVCTDNPQKAWDALWSSDVPDVSVWIREPSSDTETDYEWISRMLKALQSKPDDEFCLLRPTSPFRNAQTIRRALERWESCKDRLDSLRAVRKATEPAWKQWGEVKTDDSGSFRADFSDGYADCPRMLPFYLWQRGVVEPDTKHFHSRPTQSLSPTYIQTAALEIFRAQTIFEGSLAGNRVGMFLTEGPEALDINTPEDWEEAEGLVPRDFARFQEALTQQSRTPGGPSEPPEGPTEPPEGSSGGGGRAS